MLSAKSFRPSINTPEQANRWLRIFAADIYSRLVEEGVVENKRRPKTINLQHRQGGQMRSRGGPIPLGRKIDEVGLFELATNLLGQIILEGRVWPCANLSLSVGGFEDGVVGNMGIGAFLVKGDEAKALGAASRELSGDAGSDRPDKRRRLDAPTSIDKFFVKTESTGEHDEDFGAQHLLGTGSGLLEGHDAGSTASAKAATSLARDNEATTSRQEILNTNGPSALHQQRITDYTCSRCNQALDSSDALQSHQDWHFAKDLQDEDRGQAAQHSKSSTPLASKQTSGSTNKKKSMTTGRSKTEKGQSKLAFG